MQHFSRDKKSHLKKQTEIMMTPRLHTLLFVQVGKEQNTKTYSEYNKLDDCLDSVCKIYEEHLKKLNPDKNSITYEIDDLFEFIDGFVDLSCLVLKKETNTYVPHNKEWIKEQIHSLLRYRTKRVKE